MATAATASPKDRQHSAPALQFWAIALVGSVALAAAGHLLIKAGLNAAATAVIGLDLKARLIYHVLHPTVLIGLAVYGIGTAMWVFAVSRREISYLYPLTALNYAVVALGGKILFHERISTGRWIGIAVVALGVVLMQWSAKEKVQS